MASAMNRLLRRRTVPNTGGAYDQQAISGNYLILNGAKLFLSTDQLKVAPNA